MKIGTVIALLLAIWHWPVSAATSCTSAHLRFASSNNTLYVQAGGICRVADIAVLKPLQLVNQGGGIYLLKANLKLIDGSALMIDGDDPTDPVPPTNNHAWMSPAAILAIWVIMPLNHMG